jgi:tRNA(Phe) wybutosine-synthesizing methylase Tyw3
MWSEYRKEKIEGYERAKKRGVDWDIIPILDKINEKENYFTISSCSGRIVVIDLEDVLECICICKHQGVADSGSAHITCCMQRFNFRKKFNGCCKQPWIQKERNHILAELRCRNSFLEKLELPVSIDLKKIVENSYLRIAVDVANEKLKKGKIKLKRLEELITSL